MLDKKKLNSIAQKLNVSINFDSATPGITVSYGKRKKVTSFDSLIDYFEKDNKDHTVHFTQCIVIDENIKFSSLKNLSGDTQYFSQYFKNRTQGFHACEKIEITKYNQFIKKTKKISSSSSVTTNIIKNSYPNKGLKKVKTNNAQKKLALAS